MMEALKSSQKLLPQQVSEQIEALIREKQLKEGEKLPNEFEMAQQLQVGRGTIREAVKILVSRRVLEIRRGKGTFVCRQPGIVEDPLGFAFIGDKKRLALDLCEIRLMLEPEIAALAAERASREETEALQAAAEKTAELCRKGEPHMEMDIEFHQLLARLSKNSVVPRLIPVIQTGVSVFIEMTESALAMDTVETHQNIVEAVKAGDPQAARAAMTEHLRKNREAIEKIDPQNDLC